jgi:hypothetical protein
MIFSKKPKPKNVAHATKPHTPQKVIQKSGAVQKTASHGKGNQNAKKKR